ncbi:uncharacterized protein [Lepeophtheirus salmonis]|uniref:uncharacterized protein n=1 Tax=Lepeophtheirus salmonis TaxID=72036 RepID=UPI001AE968AF|nr:ankyrin repeat domain-containing protein 39-like [Lepeophtheirus salmonis]
MSKKENKSGNSCHCVSNHSWSRSTLDELDFERGAWNDALSGDLNKLRERILRNPDLTNALDSSGLTALHYASRSGHFNIVSFLVNEGGAKVNIASRSGGATPLHRAAYMGHIQIVSFLIDHGGDPFIQDFDGNNSLHKSSEKKSSANKEVYNFLSLKFSSLASISNNRGLKPVF